MSLAAAVPLASAAFLLLGSYWLLGLGFALFLSLVALYVFFYAGLHRKQNPVVSVEVGEALPNEGRVRRHIGYDKTELLTSPFDGVNTLYDLFQRGVKNFGNKNCLGTRSFEKDGSRGAFKWETYTQVNKRIHNFGSGLLRCCKLETSDRVGFYAKNCAEWVIGAEACNAYSLVNVALYDTLGEENRVFIVQQAEVKAIITTKDLAANVFSLAKDCPTLGYVIVAEDCPDALKDAAKKEGLTLLSFKEVEELGSEELRDAIPPAPNDLAILMYTSGTTSRPKGVLITHANLVSTVAGVLKAVMPIASDDVFLSYLPLAHILERASEAAMFCCGASVGFYQGDVRKLDDDIRTLAPTLFAGVPKVYQRVMAGIQRKVALQGFVPRLVFSIAVALQRKALEFGHPIGLLNKIVFAKVQEGLGGRVKQVLSGGAPLSADCHEFIRICFGCPIMQGYGLTETCGGSTITPFDLPVPYGRAGTPIPCCEVKLVDTANYTSSSNPPQGEVCVSGPNVTKGYYKMEEKTREDFREEADGRTWFHTGDVGQWNQDGTLSIIGRTKDIFKLDGGEYVAPERLETIFAGSKFVNNIFVYGDSSKAHIVAVVVPEPVAAKHWAQEKGITVEDGKAGHCPESLCRNESFRKAVMEDLNHQAAKAKLNRFEYVQGLYLDPVAWLPESGLVTAALKNKRPELTKAFAEQLDDLYAH